ncbi:hypothetical protein [Nostoc sp. DedQUE09]|uniref:hypothetical protein n=1 Tax=Nostoc sp. DedQUE09 TaxID=3075394 RepID=UPI002AD260F7|nr:hypothetical protein [Nostoc sp. DedQUE09]MDZ7951181.1 hypothetical protein [Nostoc sp. DedQUE09]
MVGKGRIFLVTGLKLAVTLQLPFWVGWKKLEIAKLLVRERDRSQLFHLNSKLWRSHKISVYWQVRSHKLIV